MASPPLDDILDALSLAVLRLDDKGRIQYLNPSAADLLETGIRHAHDRLLAEILPVDERLAAYIARALAHGEPLALAEMELFCGPPPARRRRVACNIQPLEQGGVQIELNALDRRQLIAEENTLWQNRQAQRRLFQALAHEIKNPLGGLRGAAQLLAVEIDRPELREYLDVMLRETGRLRDLVDALLGAPRAPILALTNIHAVLEHVHGVLAPAMPAGIAWKRDYDPSLPELRADADQLTQVFLNLAGNAIEALNDRGEIRVRTRIERQYTLAGLRHRMAVRIDIEDNGPGVPDSIRDSLFLPLVTGRAEGSGLGLAIAQDIVQRHGGLIEYGRDTATATTVFSVILPLLENHPETRQ
jgi:two-component system nitrogen regulation sensor histidine kinase GlnL